MFVEDFELQIINRQLELNLSYVQCLCVWMKAGIKFSSICQTSHEEHMVLTTYRH